MTQDISGLSGIGSSASVALTLSLANRLRDRLGSDGSTEYSQTWKRKITPVGRRYWAHTASGRRTSDSGSGGWPSPKTDDGHKRPPEYTLQRIKDGKQIDLGMLAQTAGWPSPKASNTTGAGTRGEGGENLQTTAQLAGWGTPTSQDAKHATLSPSEQQRDPVNLRNQAYLAGWPTPTATDRVRDEETMAKSAAFRKRNANQNTVPLYLGEVAQMAGWPTPMTEGSSESSRKTKALSGGRVAPTDAVKGWATPRTKDADGWRSAKARQAAGKPEDTLCGQATLAGWATPRTRDWKDSGDTEKVAKLMEQDATLPRQVAALISGQPTTSSPAPTENRGALNPAFSLWLMGYPPAWESCAPPATRSSRRSRRRS